MLTARTVIATVSACFMAGSMLIAEQSAPVHSDDKPRILRRNDVPLAQRLTNQDKVVVVLNNVFVVSDPIHFSGTPEENLRRLLMQSSASAMVRITATNARLVERGTWVRTTVIGILQEVFKDGGMPGMGPGTRFEAEYEGGRVSIGDTDVQAGMHPRFERDGSYILFFSKHPDEPKWYPSGVLAVKGGILEDPGWTGDVPKRRSLSHGLPVASAMQVLRGR